MQHYGIPTRLLDWSEVFGVAIFFALLGSTEEDEAAIYLLDPIALNQAVSGRPYIPLVFDDPNFDYKKMYWNHEPVKVVHPFAIEAPAQNSRIIAQRGRFTIHGADEKSLDAQFPQYCTKVMLGHEAKEGAREFLRVSGINEFSIFPDPAGLAPFLAKLVGIR